MDALMFLHFVTRALTRSPESRGVYLFGSTARELRTFVSGTCEDDLRPMAADFVSKSNDLDLVITVESRIYETWNRELNNHLSCVADCAAPADDSYDGCKWVRFNLALELLGCGTSKEFGPLYGWLRTLDEDKELDLHLMPEDWRSRTTDLQDDLPHHDPLFVSNIAQDAILLTGHDTSHPYDWQDTLLLKLARLQGARQQLDRSTVISSVISAGLTAAGTMPQG